MNTVEIVTSGPLDFVTEPLSDAVDAAKDFVTSVWDRIPGSEYLGDAVKAVVEGPLREFAQSGIGEFTLNAMAAAAGGMGHAAGLASFMPILGPVLLISSAAIPGVLAGGDFGESMVKGWMWRLETAAQIVGPHLAAQIGEAVGKASEQLKELAAKAFPGMDPKDAIRELGKYGIDAEAIARQALDEMGNALPSSLDAEAWAVKTAKEMGTRADAVLHAYDLTAGTNFYDVNRWDLITGLPKFLGTVKAPVASTVSLAPTKSAVSKFQAAMAPKPVVPVSNTATSTTKTISPILKSVVPSFKAPVANSTNTVNTSLQQTLAALAAEQAAVRASVPAAPALPAVPGGFDRAFMPGDQGTEQLTLLEAKSFWDKHKTKVLVGGGVLLAAGILYYAWGRE